MNKMCEGDLVHFLSDITSHCPVSGSYKLGFAEAPVWKTQDAEEGSPAGLWDLIQQDQHCFSHAA
jgi:hypothetical protein